MVAKRELAFMPLVGWSWCFMEVVFLRRRWAEDFHTVKHSLQRLKDYPENIWVGEVVIAWCYVDVIIGVE